MEVNLICLGLSCLLCFVGPMAFLVLCGLKHINYGKPFLYGVLFSVLLKVFAVVFVQSLCSTFLKLEPVFSCFLSEFVGVTICEIGRFVALFLARRSGWFSHDFFELIAFAMGYFSGKSVLLAGVLNWLNFFQVVSSTISGNALESIAGLSGNVAILSLFSEFVSSFELVVEVLLTLIVAMFFNFERIKFKFLCVFFVVFVQILFSGLKFVLSLVFNLSPFVVQFCVLIFCLTCLVAVFKLKILINWFAWIYKNIFLLQQITFLQAYLPEGRLFLETNYWLEFIFLFRYIIHMLFILKLYGVVVWVLYIIAYAVVTSTFNWFLVVFWN